MRADHISVQLALWASTAHAFYPYAPEWWKELNTRRREARTLAGRASDGTAFAVKQRNGPSTQPSPEVAAREAARLASKYAGRQPSSLTHDANLARRDNEFEIMEAEESGDDLTSGIDQDGTDYSYFVEVELGSGGSAFHMLIDTGAGSSWIMGSECDTEACSLHDLFGSEDSDTLETTDEEFSINYGTGSVSGTLASDTISLAGMSFTYEFGVATDTSDDFLNFAFDGILGLSMSQGENQNFLEAIDESDSIDDNVFGVALNRAEDGTNTGEIMFGSANSERYTGDITWTPVSSENGEWAITIEDMSYDGQAASVGGVLAYIDTGTTFIFGPKSLVKALHDIIPGAQSSDGVTYRVPCDSEGPLSFTFSGVDFEVSPKDWISPQNSGGLCTSNVYGQEVVRGSWLLGATFIKNVYAIFDKDESRIGFATPVGADSSAPTTTSSGSQATSTTTFSMTTSTGASNSTTSATPSQEQEDDGPTATADGDQAEATDDDNASMRVSPSALTLALSMAISAFLAVAV